MATFGSDGYGFLEMVYDENTVTGKISTILWTAEC